MATTPVTTATSPRPGVEPRLRVESVAAALRFSELRTAPGDHSGKEAPGNVEAGSMLYVTAGPDRLDGVDWWLLQADPAFASWILAPIEILGVDAFGEWSVKMKARIRTMPRKQWEVGRELRRRLIKAFERNGFAIPFPVPGTAVHPAARPDSQ